MSAAPEPRRSNLLRRLPEALGAFVRKRALGMRDSVVFVGGITRLHGALGDRVLRWIFRLGVRIRIESLVFQAVRVGVRSIPIVVLVQIFIGIILALNLEPTLTSYGQTEQVATVVAIAILRELGPLITAIIISGFAGASIAAELGTMVEGEEIKALRAHALDPIRFLVAPRVIATSVMMVGLTVLADVAGVLGGFLIGVTAMDIPAQAYLDLTQAAVGLTDYFTGLFKGGVFGLIVGMLACYIGLNVRGGSEGVGLATTATVVISIVALIFSDMIFTAVFYALGL